MLFELLMSDREALASNSIVDFITIFDFLSPEPIVVRAVAPTRGRCHEPTPREAGCDAGRHGTARISASARRRMVPKPSDSSSHFTP